ncbi:MAG: adenosine deaminase [bacterium]
MPDKLEQINQLPKIDLHHHMDGAIRTKTIKEMAEKHDVELPTYNVEKLKDHVTVRKGCEGLTDFLDCFELFYPVIQYEDAIRRIAYELCETTYNQDVLYLETRFAPVLLTEEGLSQEEVVTSALDGLEAGLEEFDVEINLILCVYRGTPPEASLRTVELAQQYSDRGIVGIDIAGDESQYDADPHREAFDNARQYGLNITAHAGEAGGVDNIREALNMGADRIGHGVALRDDPEVLAECKERQIPLEMCLTSNLQTGVVRTIEEHPVTDYFDHGTPVTLNTDDPAVSNINIHHEFRLAFQQTSFTIFDLKQILQNSVSASFADSSTRQKLRTSIDQL